MQLIIEGSDTMTDYEKALALWRQKHITSDAELSEALNGQSISFAYHSGKIENDRITYHDIREIFEHDGVTSYTGDLRTLFEIRNSRDAYEYFLTAFQERHVLDENLIQKMQLLLTQNTYNPRRWQLGEPSINSNNPLSLQASNINLSSTCLYRLILLRMVSLKRYMS